MATRVVNIRDLSQAWEQNPDYVYIGRGRGGILGNPYSHLGGWTLAEFVVSTRQQAVESYMTYATERITKKDQAFIDALRACRDKTLVCWCKPLACHGDAIISLLVHVPVLRGGTKVNDEWYWCRCGREQVHVAFGYDTCSKCLKES